jgi:hypothetical protein
VSDAKSPDDITADRLEVLGLLARLWHRDRHDRFVLQDVSRWLGDVLYETDEELRGRMAATVVEIGGKLGLWPDGYGLFWTPAHDDSNDGEKEPAK